MASRHTAKFPAYSAIVPVELLLAVVVPVAAAFLFDLPWVPLAAFVIAALPAAAALHAHRFMPVPRSAVLAGAATYLAALILSTMVATATGPVPYLDFSIRSLLVLYFLFLLSMVPQLDGRHAGLLLVTVLLAASVNAGVNSALFLTGDPRADYTGIGRLIAVFGLPGGRWTTTVSAAYAVTFALGFALMICPAHGRWVRLLAAVAILPIGLALILTEARSGVLGAAVGAMAAFIVVPRRSRFIVVVGLVGVLLVLLAVLLELILDRGASYRSDIWLHYLRWAWEEPVFGQGLVANVHRVVLGVEFHHAHNLLVSAWVRGGVFGFIGMALMLGGGIYWTWRYGRSTGNPVYLAMIVAIGVAGMFDYELLPELTNWTWAAFWLPIGLAAGAEIAMRQARGTAAESESGRRGSPALGR
jgi:O-antigen ligase